MYPCSLTFGENAPQYTTNPCGSLLTGGRGVWAKRESQASPPGKGSEAGESKGQAELAFKGALPQVYRALQQPCDT